MNDQLLKALQAVDRQSTWEDLVDASKYLFLHSDEYHCTTHSFNPSEVEAVANAISQYISDPHTRVYREIVFDIERPLEGKSIDYGEYAKMFSEDMLFQNYSTDFVSLDAAALRRALKAFLAAIFLRYAYCVASDMAAFPVSVILNYTEALSVLLSKEQRGHELPDALLITLHALRSLEPTAEDMKEFLDRMSDKWMKKIRRGMN